MDKLKVLIADDNVVYRKILSEAVDRTGLGEVIHTASNGSIALEWLRQCDIDVVLMDVWMPEVNGIDALKEVKKDYKDIEVIMISGVSQDSAQYTIEALKHGALDYIVKPSESCPEKNFEKIKSQLQMLLAEIKVKKCSVKCSDSSSVNNEKQLQVQDLSYRQSLGTIQRRKAPLDRIDLIVIASSTGGPTALEKVCTGLGAGLNKPILVVQHMPPEFTRVLAQSLDKKCGLSVVEGNEGMEVKCGQIIIAPGGFHMALELNLKKERVVRLEKTPYVNGVRPAADVLFDSVARVYPGDNILAVVLTGMGSDGMKGVAAMKHNCNCYCITQSEDTCVVYGMPRSVVEAGLSDESLALRDISGRIMKMASNGR